jgi:hypothetical protein
MQFELKDFDHLKIYSLSIYRASISIFIFIKFHQFRLRKSFYTLFLIFHKHITLTLLILIFQIFCRCFKKQETKGMY